MSIYKLRPNP